MLHNIIKIIDKTFQRPLHFLTVYFFIFTVSYAFLFYFDFLPEPISNAQTLSDTSTSMSSILILGITAGLLQLFGYILYLTNKNIDPNPVSWFMFAYGTAILTILEWDSLATVPELILPTVCAVLAIYVSFKCWRKYSHKNKFAWWPHDWWPEDKWEQRSFISDIVITIGYISAWILAAFALVTSDHRELAVLVFLFLSNLSTFPSFYPLLRETYLHPNKEDWKPWTIWALAYAILALVTFTTHNAIIHPLMFYPISNAFLHAMVGWLARPSAQRRFQLSQVKIATT